MLDTASLSKRDRDRILSTASHEAAHAVIAAVHGATVDRAEVVRSGGKNTTGTAHLGYTRYLPFDAMTRLDVPLIAAAGAAGEAIFRHGKPTLTEVWHLLNSGHKHDAAQVEQLSLAKGINPIEPVGLVMPITNRCWPSIARLANGLFRGGEIRHNDVLQALNIPSAEDADKYLRAIRAGAVPGELRVGRLHF